MIINARFFTLFWEHSELNIEGIWKFSTPENTKINPKFMRYIFTNDYFLNKSVF
ncbi:hypothetical protein PB70LOC_03995 [Pectobacterium versatile]|nr:Hypothetical protein SCC1_4345 [Pectobacterium versatile]POY55900.1 hypothetical protein PB70LOC_03995 [Pectobacterium versatile]POY61302.1 hypothetical protein PB69LOC_04154 [Pectobacterium versatile]PVY72715.1 hypothetical protein C7330_1827 [Pectobacterium versatile]GKV83599.1 hypothetical protein PEC106664_43730 [Pectobacterium carotovorum subsp. carotovorum]